MKWSNIHLVWVALPVLLVLFMAVRDRLKAKGVFFSQAGVFHGYKPSLSVYLRYLPLLLRVLAVAALVIAVLRPQALKGENEVALKGINIMLVVDLSGSMVAEDLKPDRITAEKKVLQDFISRIKNDKVGLVVFGAKSFTQSPLTMDYDVLKASIQEIDLNTVDADGTAIGDGILSAVNRLAEFDGQTNVIIMATDGTNNRGEEPLKAAEIAEAKKIRIFTVGIGAKGGAPVFTVDQFGVKTPFIVDGKPMRWDEPNDDALKEVATKTGGEYFRATDEQSLDAIYTQIDQLIKDEKKRRDPHYKELFTWFLFIALGSLFLEALLSATWLRSFA
ncbi:VWA domain-containing protein [candidate division FCPU426 bacterium]|nr:VWA domain-containing protein [candidate division FCPU426 bacterium]